MTTQVMEIGGMTCGHCMGRVRDALAAIPGVTVERVQVGRATVSFDEKTIDPAAIEQAVEDAGYDVLQRT
jgi:copper chaperone